MNDERRLRSAVRDCSQEAPSGLTETAATPRGYPLLSRVQTAAESEHMAEPVERAHGDPHHGRGVAAHEAADLVAQRVLPAQHLARVVSGEAPHGVHVPAALRPLSGGTRRPPAPGPRYRVEAPPHARLAALPRDSLKLLVALRVRPPVVHEVRDGVLLGDAPLPLAVVDQRVGHARHPARTHHEPVRRRDILEDMPVREPNVREQVGAVELVPRLGACPPAD